jgi:hypothetical protein
MNTSHFNVNKVSIYSLAVILIKLLVVTAFACLITLSGCTPPEEKVDTDRVANLLTSSAWTIESVTVDGVDRTSSHEGMTVKFTGTRFTSTNGGRIWPASGIWTFADDSGTVIVRGDDIEITIQEINETRLVLSFTWTETTLGAGRVSSTEGEHVFTFTK